MKASDYIISFLKAKGVTHIFSLSGWMITHLEDAIFRDPDLTLVSVKHEQAWAFAAEGYTRVSGVTAVALATSGPGATNLITGIASAYFDSAPVLYITWQVRTDEITPDDVRVRQTGFQETKIVPIVEPITKYAKHITQIDELRYELEKAYDIMHSGRKWPVLLDISMDIQQREISPDELPGFLSVESSVLQTPELWQIDTIVSLLRHAERPILLVWGGVRIAGASDILAEFLSHTHLPVVSSLMGIDAVPQSYPGYIGMIGSYGVRHANILLSHADVVLVIGSRLDLRQTGAIKSEFAKHAKIIHIDIDKNELWYTIEHTYIKCHIGIVSFLEILLQRDEKYPDYPSWYDTIDELQKLLPTYSAESLYGYIHPNFFFSRLSELFSWSTVYVNDVGQNQMWASQSLQIQSWQRLLNSGGLGAMGFSLPASIGAASVPWVERVVSIHGDGWFQMNIQELETIVSRWLPIGIFVLNNKSLGMVREFQDNYFNGRNIGTVIGYSCPDLSRIAWAYGLPYFRIAERADMEWVFAQIRGLSTPYIVEVLISDKAIVEPKMMYGSPMDRQSPPLSDALQSQIDSLFL